ncbi:hypothetical protein [Deinococcus sp. Leaf326]|uniref:hypothetical protein n=1 Tax=Deinococcus sp. Leaf326 TaxID=1736338 RepID=UPI000AE8A63F|nr:hypothetical protein [Deinococcus sp. Leaf326]
MNTTAAIGSYSSPKLLVTGFDVQRTNERVIQQTASRKLVGKAKQNIKLSLSGYINCSTFSELDGEVDALVEALNAGEIQVWIGAQPDRFYTASWAGAGLDRRPGAGGPTLPFSLDFDVLEEAGVRGLPVSYGAVRGPGLPFLVSTLGKPAEDVSLRLPGAFFASLPTAGYSDWVIRDAETDSGLHVVRSGDALTVSLMKNGTSVTSWSVPAYETVNLGLVLGDTRATVYVEGIPYIYRQPFKFFDWVLTVNPGVSMYGAFAFTPSAAFMRMVARAKTSDLMNYFKVDGSSFIYSGADKTPASVYAVTTPVYLPTFSALTTSDKEGVTWDDFGAAFGNYQGGWFNFNGITREVVAEYPSALNDIDYNGRFSLFPRLKQGTNKPTITAGIEEAYVFWRERIR